MSTPFQPIEIPSGVMTRPTKAMRSSNWAEVNLVRWTEGQLSPVGGQAQFPYSFASTCRKIHGWYDLAGTYHIAYLCEKNVYVDTGGTLTEITPSGGMQGPTFGVGGYGDLTYNLSTYGTARAQSTIAPITQMPDAYSVDNFGAILLVMTSADGRFLSWDPAAVAGTLLTAVTGAPQGRLFVVTNERFVVVFGLVLAGVGNAFRFGWCDQEDYTDWNFADVANQAGFYDIQPSSPFITAIAGRYGVLFFTAKQAFILYYSGLPYVYSYTQIGDNCTPWSPNSLISTAAQTAWISEQGLWTFDGTNITPVPCPVMPWVLKTLDLGMVREYSFAVHVSNFNEVWWFFPETGNNYNTKCIIFNYKEGWWSQGQMQRSAGITSSYTAYVIMAKGAVAFQHELGNYYSADAMLPFAETFNLNLTSGSRFVTVKQILPDLGGAADSPIHSLFYRNSRSQGAPELQTPLIATRPDGYIDCRTTGRDIRLRLQAQGPSVPFFTVGQYQIDSTVRGDR
jgi:hypothetical protein